MANKVLIDRIKFMEKFLRIDNKERQVVPLKLNEVQKYFMDKKGNRNIILKARQLGISSLVLADLFFEAITVPNTTCVVVSHEQHATERLLAKVYFYHNSMPEPKPEMGRASASEITFPNLRSTIYIGTARSMTFGRGDRIDKCHLSELSVYEDGERILNAVEEAVPLHGEITIECTPNGEDNIFYEVWSKANEGKSGYKPFFFPWWFGPDYTLDPNSPYALEEDLGKLVLLPEEQELMDVFGITEDQLRWRRRKLADKGGLFFQEYPEDPVSCFQQTGEPVFDPFILLRLSRQCYDGVRHPQGFQVWIEPQKDHRYVIGADSSFGTKGGSFSAAAVLDEDYNVCATFQGKLEPPSFAELLKQMGLYYNKAELAVERNQPGYAVLSELLDYPNIYYQRDYTTGRIMHKPGWWTSQPTKQFMITAFKDALPRLKIWDMNLIRQARSYKYVKWKETATSFDDLLIASMIACAVKRVDGGGRGYVGAVPGWGADW